jgi:alkanesulfonate monooxygenase SsuD/methylene tetrahydromethanopterin reductase-like flavin-dependent oxidoreductase (luciferase family)
LASEPRPRPALGFCFDRTHPAPLVIDMARRAEAGGLDELWLIEDCFYTAGPPLAASALAVTERIHVGIGILPAVARNAAVTAMEIATLAALAPGRFHAGVGHGVQEWMEQMGARPASPVTTLAEVTECVCRLLRGEAVTYAGRHVTLTDVTLAQRPDPVPPVSLGVRGPRSLRVSGRVADGTILAEFAGPTYARWARDQIAAGTAEVGRADAEHRVTVFAALHLAASRAEAIAALAPALGGVLDEPNEGIRQAPFGSELITMAAAGGGESAARAMPVGWWDELAAAGTIEDVLGFVERLGDAGVDAVAFFPGPEVAMDQLDLLVSALDR